MKYVMKYKYTSNVLSLSYKVNVLVNGYDPIIG